MASLLLIFSPLTTCLTANSTILPLLVLGISGTLMIIEGTCFGEQFFLILDLIDLIFHRLIPHYFLLSQIGLLLHRHCNLDR